MAREEQQSSSSTTTTTTIFKKKTQINNKQNSSFTTTQTKFIWTINLEHNNNHWSNNNKLQSQKSNPLYWISRTTKIKVHILSLFPNPIHVHLFFFPRLSAASPSPSPNYQRPHRRPPHIVLQINRAPPLLFGFWFTAIEKKIKIVVLIWYCNSKVWGVEKKMGNCGLKMRFEFMER